MNNMTAYGASTKERRIDIYKVVDAAVLTSFVVSAAVLVYQIFFQGVSNESYTLMLVQCVLGSVVLHLPQFIGKKLKMEIPGALRLMFSLFLFCAIFLGEVMNFYFLVPHWDDVLHLSSGMMIGFLGYMLTATLNRKTLAAQSLSPIFTAIFAVSFALCVGALWEVYEYCFDGLLGLNMQKTMLQSGEILVGHNAITDTVKDLVVDTAGALIAAIGGYFSIKKQKGWIYEYMNTGEERI